MKHITLGFCIVFLSACVSTGPKVQQLESKKSTSFTYATSIQKDKALKLVADGLLDQSRLKKQIKWSSGYRQISYSTNAQGVVINYIHAQRDGSSSGKMTQTVTSVSVPVKVEATENQTKITVAEPVNAEENAGRNMLFIALDPYDDLDKIIANTRFMVDNLKLDPYVQHVGKDYELVSKYKSNSIRDNFSRLASCKITGKSNDFCVIKDVKCYIKVFDYRDGSKIVSRLTSEISYNPDGTSDSSAIDSKIAVASNRIKEIVTD